MDPNAAERIGQNYQDWLNYFPQGRGRLQPGRLHPGADAQAGPGHRPGGGPAPAAPDEAAPPPAAAAPAEPNKPPSTLEEFRAQLQEARTALAAAGATAKDEKTSPRTSARRAAATATTLRSGVTAILTQIAAEENRVRDEAAAAKKEEEAKKEKERLEAKADAKVADTAPKNGDERWTPIETKDEQGRTVRGVGKEVYTNGVWKYQPRQRQGGHRVRVRPPGAGRDALGGHGWAGHLLDPEPPHRGGQGHLRPPGGGQDHHRPGRQRLPPEPGRHPPARSCSTPPPRRSPTTGAHRAGPPHLPENLRGRPQDPRRAGAGQPHGTGDRRGGPATLQPKFASAQAQYAQEAQRRQKLARTELDRLLKLQEEGQIGPEQAQTQFDRWMGINVEGPLAGYERAALQERPGAGAGRPGQDQRRGHPRRGVQHPPGPLRLRGRRGGRHAGDRDRGAHPRAGVHRGPGAGGEQHGDGATLYRILHPAPRCRQLPQGGPQRQRTGRRRRRPPALAHRRADNGQGRERAPPASPYGGRAAGPDGQRAVLRPDAGAPPNGQPLEGQGAIDLESQGKPGMARSVYSNGRYVDWPIRPSVPVA